jgi:uncharacterized membrane protein YcaP (DUF421 family)
MDFLVVIAFGSAVGDVMVYHESVTRFGAAVVSLMAVTLIVKALDKATAMSDRVAHILEGGATVLVDEGEYVKKNMRREGVSKENISSVLREKDVHDIKKVKKLFLEADGEYSVVLKKK